MGCTLVAAFFPLVFLYTSVAYSEPLLLFLSLSLWLLYLRGSVAWASLLLAIASVTRPYGILFGHPVVIDLLAKKRFTSLAYLALPAASILAWLYYSYHVTGDWIASHTAQVTFWNNGENWLQGFIIPFLRGGDVYAIENNHPLLTLTLFMVSIFALLVLLTFESDWRLGVMSSVLYLAIILLAGPPQ